MKTRAISGSLLVALAIGSMAWPARAANSDDSTSAAQKLVDDALRAEVAGDATGRKALLGEALHLAPDYQPARWHSGQLLANGDWRAIDDAQKAAAADPRRAEYQLLREANRDSLDGQLALARWCRKNGLGEEAAFHWRTVLSHQPNNNEALRALGVRWYAGRLMTFAEADAEKVRQRKARRAAKKFEPQVAQWERLLSAGDVVSRDKALAEIRAFRNTDAIPVIEDVTLGQKLSTHAKFERAMQVGLALVAALDQVPNQAATESLVRHAAFSQVMDVREAAIEALKRRPLHDYVPLLLSGLAMPIESSFRVATDADGSVHYWHSLYREGPETNWSFEGRLSAMQYDLQGPLDVHVNDQVRKKRFAERYAAGTNPALQAEMASVAATNARKFGSQGSAANQQVAAINEATEAANALIYPVLVATTDQQLGESPRSWWDWWQGHNEYESEGEEPVYERSYAESSHRYYRAPQDASYTISPPPPPPPPGGYRRSCFAAGTLVWTNTGQREIETLEIGDLVLAQDADTGELAYKPIIGRTVRAPSQTVKLALAGEEVQTTLGHPLWVAGLGWRMAKELDDGAILHGLHGPVRIDAIQPADEIEAYNLIVADFNTYFVGTSGILAHDNTPREPTTAKVPGLVED